MSKVAILADTNCGIKKELAQQEGIFLVPMPFFIDEKLYYEDVQDILSDEYAVVRKA